MVSMEFYSKAAMERTMKVQEVILRALAKKITWWQATEIIGISDRHMRRWRERYEEFGYDGLFDRRSHARAASPGTIYRPGHGSGGAQSAAATAAG
jgi:Homeodomain-like domain